MRRKALDKENLKEKVQAQVENTKKKGSLNTDIFEFFERRDKQYLAYKHRFNKEH